MGNVIMPFLGAVYSLVPAPEEIGEKLNNNSGLLAALIALSIVLLFSTYKKKNDEVKAKEAERETEQAAGETGIEKSIEMGEKSPEEPTESEGERQSGGEQQ